MMISISKKDWNKLGDTDDTEVNIKLAQADVEEGDESPEASEIKDRPRHMDIASTILQQLGGSRFIVMTGARHFMAVTDGMGGLSFRLPAKNFYTKDGINYVKIILNDSDLYDATFGKLRGSDYKIMKEYKDLYFDALQEVFTDVTGLDTHL